MITFKPVMGFIIMLNPLLWAYIAGVVHSSYYWWSIGAALIAALLQIRFEAVTKRG